MSKLSSSPDAQNIDGPALPGLDCGTCGFRTCAELSARLAALPSRPGAVVGLAPAEAETPAVVPTTT